MHCPWRYLCESALLCFAICYLLIPLTCFLYACQVQMKNRNFRNYTVQDLVNKMKKLRQKYKQEKDKSSRSGTGKRKEWKLFEIIDRTLCDKPQVKPPLVIDSSVCTYCMVSLTSLLKRVSSFPFLYRPKLEKIRASWTLPGHPTATSLKSIARNRGHFASVFIGQRSMLYCSGIKTKWRRGLRRLIKGETSSIQNTE